MFTSDAFDGLGVAWKFAQVWEKRGGGRSDLDCLANDAALVEEFVQICKGSHPTFVYRIVCDATPRNSEVYKVKAHAPQGIVEWKPGVVKLLNALQALGSERLENSVRVGEWKHPRAANACVLEFLQKRPLAAPKEMMELSSRARFIFGGTRYHIGGDGNYASYDAVPALEWRIQYHDWGLKYLESYEHVRPDDVLVTLA